MRERVFNTYSQIAGFVNVPERRAMVETELRGKSAIMTRWKTTHPS